MELDTNQSQGSEQTTNGTGSTPTTPVKPQEEIKDSTARFRGSGTSFKAKLIGIDDVPESRGDKMCQDSILKLKAAVLASGQHKQKIIINVSLKGLRIINLTNGDVEHEHAVHRISFIARDLTDRRAFGYIYGAGEGKHSFFAIKTAKIAEHLVLALRDLFQVVYDLKKKEMEEAKQKAESPNEEETYAVPNNRPAPQAQQQESNLLAMEQQLQDMQGLNELDAFNPWPEDTPTSPDTPGSPTSSDMFGIASEGMTQSSRNKSYSDDLAGFDMQAVQPAATPGAKLTKDQILAGFPAAAPPQMPAYQQQMAGMQIGGMPQMGGQMGGYQQGFQPQGVPAMGVQPGYANPNPFGQGFQAPAAQAAYGAFPSGPSPAIPARPGAMQPPVAVVAQTGAPQNPFGDALAPTAQLMAPVSTNASQNGSDGADEKKPSDPFASLIPGMGAAPAGNKKDMFKNFQMAKPPQPPPRSAENVSANFESYMRKSVGGVPLDDANNNMDAPVPAPRSVGQDAFGSTGAVNGAADASSDPFAMFNSAPAEPFNFANQPQQQNASLFG